MGFIIQFAKSHEKFELVSSSLSNERHTGLKTRRRSHDNLFVFGTKSKFNFIPSHASERLKSRANIPIQNMAN